MNFIKVSCLIAQVQFVGKEIKKCSSWKTWAVHYEEIVITVLLICVGRVIYMNWENQRVYI